ncbi:MAG: DUF5680 domain-containing protein [Pseudomonadota bacterium]
MTFADFLALARTKTYAIPYGEPLGDNTEHMAFDHGDWRYRDRYTGHNPYGGQELVWFQGQTVWMKNYLAQVLSDICPMDDIYDFQRHALGQPDPNHLMRGPALVEQGSFRYTNEISRDIQQFAGTETIWFGSTPVYRMVLHGGALRPLP